MRKGSQSPHEIYRSYAKSVILLQVISGPEPIDNTEWFKDNDLIRSQPRFSQSSDGSTHTLDIRAIDYEDEGIYKCVLLNNCGIASCSAEVLVEGNIPS